MSARTMLQAALNGGRSIRPSRARRTSSRRPPSEQTLDADACDATLRAIRATCPGVPISLTTSAAVAPDTARRLAQIGGWRELPDS